MLLGQHSHQPGTNNVARESRVQSVNSEVSRTELDLHANMPYMGREALVVLDTGRVVEMNPSTPDYHAIKLRLVDTALKYSCPFTDKTYVLLVRNALHVPSMDHNLSPSFVLREAGIRVNGTPKIHGVNPTVNDHAITSPGEGLRIPLGLWEVFSYFLTSKPSIEEVNKSKSVYTLTPNIWNPHVK
eukprot:9440915-Ditylum_brightwellii.AAC.1